MPALEWAIENLDFEEKLGWNRNFGMEYKHFTHMLIREYKNKANFKTDFNENQDDIYCLIECCNEEFYKYSEEIIAKWEESQHPFSNHPPVSQEQFDAETREFEFGGEVRRICKWVQQELKKNVRR